MNKLGFGFLRLPRLHAENEKNIDYKLLETMVDTFLERGGVYFDTAYTYLDGISEEAIRRTLVERYPRSHYQLADKLPGYLVKQREDCERFFQIQCQRCNVTWFDVYLLHWLNRKNYKIAEQFQEFVFLEQLKAAGKAKKIGFSYHGDAALLEEILNDHPEVDIVQLQINYLDWNDLAIDSKGCYEVAQRHGKEIVVMEPVKGGTLAALPEEAEALLRQVHPDESSASWALRFAQGLEQVATVLSGMNTLAQLEDNLRDTSPLTMEELRVLERVCEILNQTTAIPCTGCGYCVSHCPKKIPIPDCFRLYNSYARHPEEGWKIQPVYEKSTLQRGKASDCIGCRQCEKNCPQQISIPQWMIEIAAVMEQ